MWLIAILAILGIIVVIALFVKEKVNPTSKEEVDEVEAAKEEVEKLLEHAELLDDDDDEEEE